MDNVISQLQSAGLIIDGMPDIGILRRCKVDGDRGGKESGWYILHELTLDNGERVNVGRYGNWKTLGPESVAVTFDKPVSAYDLDRIKKETQAIREQAEVEKKMRAMNAAVRAKDIWEKLPETGSSDYLVKKQVMAHGVRFSRGSIVVPVRNDAGDLAGLQFIDGAGGKKFLTGTAKKGCWHSIGAISPSAPLYICEGYATGASIHKAMGWPVAVAFDAVNLTPVAKALHKKYPDLKIIVCADNDIQTLGNPGVKRAREAAGAIGGLVAVPAFPADGCRMSGTDFNDLHVMCGIDAVREQLNGVLAANDGGDIPLPDVPIDDEFYDQYEPSHALPDARGGFGRWTFPEMVEHISLIYGTDTVWDGRENIQMKLSHLRHIVGREMFKLWDETPLRKIVRGMVFEPSGEIPMHTVNLFTGFAISPGTLGARGCPKILQHIYRLCGKRDAEFEWLIRWMSYPLQNPGAKMASSVVMHGDEGTGKSLIWDEVIGKIYGEYMITVGQLQIESAFTGWQSKKCLALCEEVVARNEKAHYKGMLKHLVTGRTLVINEKNLPARSENNHMNSVFLSNSMNPLELDLGDRRYMVLFITDVPDKAYFDDLVAEIYNGGVEEFYQHLLRLDLKGFHAHTQPPMNIEKQHLIEAGLPNAVLFFNEWRDGLLGLPFGPCSKASLYDAYKRWCEQKNEFKRRDRDVSAELRRYLVEDKLDIRLPDDFKERKTWRCWVPKDFHQMKGSADYARTIEVHCQEFLGAFHA